MFGSYFNRALMSESGGDPYAKNPRSSATGPYQFTDGTWQDLMNSYPELALTADGRTDPAQAQRAMERFTQDNATALKNGGFDASDNNLYAAHRFGATGALNLLRSDPNTPVGSVVSPQVMAANPDLNGKTVGQVINRFGAGSPDAMAYGDTNPNPGITPRGVGNFGGSQTIFSGKPRGVSDSGSTFDLTNPNIGELPNSMIGVGASLASISSPAQGAALAAMNKPEDNYSMTYNPKTGALLRINKKTGKVEAVTSGVPSTNEYDESYDKGLAAEMLKNREKYRQNAVDAASSNRDLDALSGALSNPNVPQGPWGSTRLTLMKFANILGVDNAKDLADADIANTVGSKLALKLRNPADGAGMPGNFSDQDRNFLMGIVPGTNMTPEANARVIELMRAANDRAIAIDGLRRDYERAHGGRLGTGFEQIVSDWDAQHPFSSSFAKREATGAAPGGAPAAAAAPAASTLPNLKAKYGLQ